MLFSWCCVLVLPALWPTSPSLLLALNFYQRAPVSLVVVLYNASLPVRLLFSSLPLSSPLTPSYSGRLGLWSSRSDSLSLILHYSGRPFPRLAILSTPPVPSLLPPNSRSSVTRFSPSQPSLEGGMGGCEPAQRHPGLDHGHHGVPADLLLRDAERLEKARGAGGDGGGAGEAGTRAVCAGVRLPVELVGVRQGRRGRAAVHLGVGAGAGVRRAPPQGVM